MKIEAISPESRRRRLLLAASRLLSRWGYDKTSVEDIAREAGVSKGAVYLEFPGKEDLFRAVLYFELERYMADWLRRFEKDPDGWSFARMVQHSLAAIQANPLVRALMSRDRRIFGNLMRTDSELFASLISVRTELFTRLQKAGAMREDIPAPVIAYLVSVIGYGLVTCDEVIPKDARVPFEEALSGLGLLLDRGLAPRNPRNLKEGRTFILEVVKKMKSRLHAGAKS